MGIKLAADDLLVLQRWIDEGQARLAARGIRTELSADMTDWARFQDGLDRRFDPLGVTKIFRPDLHDLAGQAFWSKFTVADAGRRRRIVATHCLRAIDTGDFLEHEVRTHRLFQSSPPVLGWYPVDLRSRRHFSGRVVLGGGSWVDPNWRGTEVSRFTSCLGRVIALRQFQFDHYVVFTKEEPRSAAGMRRWCVDVLGFEPEQTEILFGDRAPYPGRDKRMTVRWWWLTPLQVLEKARSGVSHTRDDRPAARAAG